MINEYDHKDYIVNVRDVIFSWVFALAFIGLVFFILSLY